MWQRLISACIDCLAMSAFLVLSVAVTWLWGC